jgi:hypothetical protein
VNDLSVTIQTSYGDTVDNLQGEVFNSRLSIKPVGDPVQSLMLSVNMGAAHYAPTFVDVEVFQQGVSIGSARFDTLVYHCYALSIDDWCWNADPVALVLTND